MGFVIAIHVLACIFLIIMILIQQGKGGGLIDNLSSMESVLGTKTNAFLTKTTSVLAILFFITCLSLAFMSLKQSRSLMRQVKPAPAAGQPQNNAAASGQLPAAATKDATQTAGPAKTIDQAAQNTATQAAHNSLEGIAPQAINKAAQETPAAPSAAAPKAAAQEAAAPQK